MINAAKDENYYQLLGVEPDAPLEDIRASYRQLMQGAGTHPDRGGDTRAAESSPATCRWPC